MKRKLSMLLVISLILTTAPTVQADAKKKAVTKEEIISYTIEIGGAYNICPELIQAVIETESTYKPDATNGDCIGLMQVCRKYNADRMEKLGVTDLYDPYSNILVGTDYLAELIQISIDKGYRHWNSTKKVRKASMRRVRDLFKAFEDGEVTETYFDRSFVSMMGSIKHADTYHLVEEFAARAKELKRKDGAV